MKSLNTWSVTTVLRLILSVVVGLVFIALMPIYDEPFGGCQVEGFATLELGCSLWPDVLLGLGTVLLVAFIGPNQLRPYFWGLAIVTVVAVLGGPSGIKSGMHLDILSQPANLLFYWRGSGLAVFLGGLLGIGIFLGLARTLNAQDNETSKAP